MNFFNITIHCYNEKKIQSPSQIDFINAIKMTKCTRCAIIILGLFHRVQCCHYVHMSMSREGTDTTQNLEPRGFRACTERCQLFVVQNFDL